MQFAEVARMAADDAGNGPVWARKKRRKRGGFGGALVGLIVTLVALFGALTIGLSIKEGSVAGAGTVIDGWIAVGKASVLRTIGKAPAAAEGAVDKAGDAATHTGKALKAGAAETVDTLKKQ
jgi:hypothetical protein